MVLDDSECIGRAGFDLVQPLRVSLIRDRQLDLPSDGNPGVANT